MLPFLQSAFVWNILGLVVACAAGSALLITPIASSGRKFADLLETFITLLSMGLLGGVVGYLTGQSREPAIGAVLPAILSLIGGMVLYMVTSRASVVHRRLATTSMLVLVLNILVGTLWGATARENHDSSSRAAMNRELTRQMICDKRLAFEIEMQKDRKDGHLPDANPTLLVPGCTPPFEGSVDVGLKTSEETTSRHGGEKK